MATAITPALIQSVVGAVPDTWLEGQGRRTPGEQRADYATYLTDRVQSNAVFVEEVLGVR
jgi:hypothetical protein